MRRTSQLFIRLSDEERAKIDRLAESAKLAPSTAARQILLHIADGLEQEREDGRAQQEAT